MGIGSVGSFGSFQRGAQGWQAESRPGTSFDVVAQNVAEADGAVPAEAAKEDSFAPHVMTSSDPLNAYLTSGDRAAFVALYGVDIRPDGDVLSPIGMGPNEVASVMAAAGRVASGRATGTLTNADITPEYIQGLVKGFRERIDQDLPPFAEEITTPGLDVSA